MTVLSSTFVTTDVGEAETVVQQLYPTAAIHEAAQPFFFEQSVRGTDGLQVARFRCSNRARFEVEFDHIAAFGVVLGGRYEASTASTRLDTTAPFVFQHGVGSSVSEEMDLLMVNIDRSGLADDVDGRDDVTLLGSRPVSDRLGRTWRRTVEGVAALLWDESSFSNDLVRATALDVLQEITAAAFPISSPRRIERSPSGAVLRARDYLHAHAGEAVLVADAAAAAGLSVRGLHEAFRRQLGISPAVYLRTVRLEGVRAALLAATPLDSSVAGLARAWGFTHLSRFAQQYRAAYGTYPSEDLRR